jgi:hypothetical protein
MTVIPLMVSVSTKGRSTMVIKVLVTKSENDQLSVLAVDQGSNYRWEGAAMPELLKVMKGEAKKYFKATVDEKKALVLGEEVPGASW